MQPWLHCTVLYCTVLYSTVLYCTVQYSTVLYSTVLYCTVSAAPGSIHYYPSGGVFQLCPQGMINLVWFSRPGNCVFLFFFLVLLNDPSKSFHHPCFYYNLWKGNGLGFIHLGYLYPFLKKLNSDIFTQFLLFCIVEHPSNTCIKINAQQKILPSEREVQHHARNCLHCLQCLHCFYRSLCLQCRLHCFNRIGAKRLFGLDTP